MLKQRVITAMILISAMLLLIFWAPLPVFCLVLGLVTLGAAWEWTSLMGLSRAVHRSLYVVLLALLMVLIAIFLSTHVLFVVTFIWWLLAIGLIVAYPRGSEQWGRGLIWRGLMGVLVLLPCWVAINYIRSFDVGYALLYFFALIWGADSAAYFAGNAWGRHKLAPLVSPGKSVEGLLGAVGFAVLIAGLASWYSQLSFTSALFAIGLSVIAVLFSIVGDLFESMLKRYVGVKDSGRLLPGHGGLLDRIDSLTAAAPVFSLGAWLLSIYL